MSYLLAAGFQNITPDPSGLPGLNALHKLAAGASYLVLGLGVLGLLIGSAVWAISSHSTQHHHAHQGRMAVVASALATMIGGAAVSIVNFAWNVGGTFH